MLAVNDHLFLLINASERAWPITVLIAEVLATGLVFAAALLLVVLWVWGAPARRSALAATGVAAALALVSNQIVGLLWYEPRPFMVGLGRTLLDHAPENSFPSDHTTFMLTVGFALIATRAAPGWGKFISGLGVLVAWSRIFLGVHFPVDMLASALVASLFGGLSVLIVEPVRRWIMPLAEPVYEGTLRALRLSPRVFPRRAGDGDNAP
ncbi:undecaprenyl-diphosphatase [Alsobacter sp. SYSU M60028]|uniref:Undecaprenyl-diphosphatase n=1 Tax=Alsobacter ponti TaxID=2962936 RepID=A0ABT1LGT0_9HYPH|nr:undecaprenyl-diphosphatase [Alsobacter ponti]MCP8940709.1 undecaprenyl-diphosphatase [Alsobacter ponti]